MKQSIDGKMLSQNKLGIVDRLFLNKISQSHTLRNRLHANGEFVGIYMCKRSIPCSIKIISLSMNQLKCHGKL